jgi:hypothetical protein
MSDPEGFLRRWSRRKREAAEPAAPAPEAPAPLAAPDALEPPPAPDAEAGIDLESLPSLDSITADTDIRAFLGPGVPAELTRAALRRAWMADPQIRDFIGIAENQWDFTAPDGLYGFGQLGVEEARRLAAEVMDAVASVGPAPDTALVPEKGALPVPVPTVSAAWAAPGNRAGSNQDAIAVPVDEDQAAEMQPGLPTANDSQAHVSADKSTPALLRRTHGRALPE